MCADVKDEEMDELFHAVLIPTKSFIELPQFAGLSPLAFVESFDPVNRPVMVYHGEEEVGHTIRIGFDMEKGLTGELALPADLIEKIRGEDQPSKVTVRFKPVPGIGLSISHIVISAD